MYQNIINILPSVLCLGFVDLASVELEPNRDAKARVKLCSSVCQTNRDTRTASVLLSTMCENNATAFNLSLNECLV